jgi:hypothetical protein
MTVDGIIESHDAIFLMRVDCPDGWGERPSVIGVPRIAEPAGTSEIEHQPIADGRPPSKIVVRREHRERLRQSVRRRAITTR